MIPTPETLERLGALADKMYGSDDIEVDPLGVEDVSFGADGAWVRAWVFVPNATLAAVSIDNPEAA